MTLMSVIYWILAVHAATTLLVFVARKGWPFGEIAFPYMVRASLIALGMTLAAKFDLTILGHVIYTVYIISLWVFIQRVREYYHLIQWLDQRKNTLTWAIGGPMQLVIRLNAFRQCHGRFMVVVAAIAESHSIPFNTVRGLCAGVYLTKYPATLRDYFWPKLNY